MHVCSICIDLRAPHTGLELDIIFSRFITTTKNPTSEFVIMRDLFVEDSLSVIHAIAVGAAAVVGHCFSPFLLGRGGKGVATTAGVLLAFEPYLALSLRLVWVITLRWIGSVGIASVIGALGGAALGATLMLQPFSFSGILIHATSVPDQRWLGAILVLICLLIVSRHQQNIREYRQARSAASE